MKIDPKLVPNNAGVYFFRDKQGQILYIGKAANLKNRIRSYFNKQSENLRVFTMLKLVKKVTWQKTDSEIEALILESGLIKKNKPFFNIKLRDDKQYFFVGITKETLPKIFITHQTHNSNSSFVGPFTDGNALKTTMRLLRRIFPYCTCGQKHNNFCLNYHIGKCLGFCCLKNRSLKPEMRAEYQKNIKSIREVLEGKKNKLIKKLKKEMLNLGKKHNFEKAIELRDKIQKLEIVFENAKILHDTNRHIAAEEIKKALKLPVVPCRIEGYDISNIQGLFATGAMVVFSDGWPDKNQYRKFKIKITGLPNDTAMLKEMLKRRFGHPEWQYPDLVIIDGGKAQLNFARSVILKKIPIIALTKNDKHQGDHIFISNKETAIAINKLPPPVRNLILQVDAEAHRFAINYYRNIHEINLLKKK